MQHRARECNGCGIAAFIPDVRALGECGVLRSGGESVAATGPHDPESSHLDLLRAAVGEAPLERSYDAAVERGYRWHELDDSHLILP
jgi:hypothetical protein